MADFDAIFSEGSRLAAGIDGFSVRPEQRQLAATITRALTNDESLLCEAGTGTGKTFAYLVPALLSGRRVIISTGTKHLQDQLYKKDLPVVRRALDIPVTAALLKGRANYLCLHRLQQDIEAPDFFDEKSQSDLHTVKQWSTRTASGDLAGLEEIAEDAEIRTRIVSTTDNCLGQDCAFFDECFVFKARREANDAKIVVVNHSLLLADLALRESGYGEVLAKADTVIFDEAHQLPPLASEFFSQTLSSRQLKELFNDSRAAYFSDAGNMSAFLKTIRICFRELRDLRQRFGDGDQRRAWDSVADDTTVRQAVQTFGQHFATLGEQLERLAEQSKALEHCSRRCVTLRERLTAFTERTSDDWVRWLETRGKAFLLHQTPLDISAVFQERLAKYGCNSIYTSATLSVAGDFSHFARQLGLLEVTAESWLSPFDYQRQVLLYLPPDMPVPNTPTYTGAVVEAALPVIEASQGHVFLLFTSHAALNQAYHMLAKQLKYPLLKQGDAPRSQLLARFRATPHAVLLGTGSFWEGVDVRGPALSCVIIDKLPFASPGDPVFRARAAKMEALGGNPFMDYQLPQAIIVLKQGIGRLIRDINDRGVLMICDPRLTYKPYGKVFLQSLPTMKRSTEIADVNTFFGYTQKN